MSDTPLPPLPPAIDQGLLGHVDDPAELQQLISAILAAGVDPDASYDSLSPEVQQLIYSYAVGMPMKDVKKNFGSNGVPRIQETNQAWRVISGKLQEQQASGDPETKRVIAQSDNKVTDAEKKRIETKSKEADKNAQGASGSVLEYALSQSPQWLLESIGGEPSEEQKSRIVDEWNTVFGTNYSWEVLQNLPQFRDPTQMVTTVVQSALLDVNPVVTYNVTLPNNRSYQVMGDQVKGAQDLFGIGNEDLSKVIRWADAFGITDASGQAAWQPLAALMKAAGVPMSSKLEQDYARVTAPGYKPKSKQEFDERADIIERYRKANPSHGFGQQGGTADRPGAYSVNLPQITGTAGSVSQLATKYATGVNKYGDRTMGYLYALDPALAARLAGSGGDVTKVSNQDVMKVNDLLLKGGWVGGSSQLGKLGYETDSGMSSALKGFFDQLAGAGRATGPVRMKPDPESLKQDVKDFWRALFRADPSDALTASMVQELTAKIMSAPDDQDVDLTAQLRAIAERSGEYKDLYGNKPAGVSEADYQNQFLAASQSMLGNELPDEGSIRAGMRSGAYQTTVGSSAGSARAWQNSTFLGRLAQAAQVVNERT